MGEVAAVDNSGYEECIGALEHHLHDLFSSVRVPGDEFVYSPSTEMFNQLDDYCDESAFHEARPPMLIMDESGCGKSALLSNWLHRRRQKSQARKSSQSSEFVFWHAVGCTRQSTNVHSLIRRLMHDLKNKFGLDRDVPFAQDRLSWELPRFFEMASRKGKFIVILDGVHRLVTNDDAEAGLAWLPLDFPPNMRIIISATAKRSILAQPYLSSSMSIASVGSLGGGGSQDSVNTKLQSLEPEQKYHGEKGAKILAELDRRKWKHIRVRSLERLQCRAILENYITKSVRADAISMTTGPFLTAEPSAINEASNSLGFLLFDTQVSRLLTHSHGGEPQFLRLFIKSLHYAANRGFSVWHVMDDWLKADSVSALVTRILRTIESGYSPSSTQVRQDTRQTENAGGLSALRLLYAWHPVFRDMPEEKGKHDLLGNLEMSKDTTTKHTNKAHPQHGGEAGVTLSEKVKDNLGDQQWLALGGYAESVLMDTKASITGSIAASVQEIQDKTSEHHESAISETKTSAIAGMMHPMDFIDTSIKIFDRDSDAKKATKLKEEKRKKNQQEYNARVAQHAAAEAKSNELQKQESKKGPAEEAKHRDAAAEEKAPNVDVDLDKLPQYMQGGMGVSGLGTILGNALALLYVARHGLKESEIWGLLASLHEESLHNILGNEASNASLSHSVSAHKGMHMHELEVETILKVCYVARGELEDLCRAEDLAHSGLITQQRLVAVLSRLHTDLNSEDVRRLLVATEIYHEENHLLAQAAEVDYNDLIGRVVSIIEKKTASAAAAAAVGGGPGGGGARPKGDGGAKTPASKSSKKSKTTKISSLGPVLEESLLSILIALGVLHSPDNQVLVLPSDSEFIRQVVYEDYVKGRGGEAVWHGHLIKHFQQEVNSMRRCEELPWHLQICRRWHTMKECLVDLSTFKMMYDSSDLRDEFMAYWVILTEGPMFVTDESHRSAMIARQKQAEEALRGDRRDPELNRVLMELDMAAALGLSEKAARTMLLQNQVSCFDVVEEFNRSVELWVQRIRPTVTEINTKILHIARFLAEFSKKCSPQPNFMRLTINIDVLTLFGVNFDILKQLDPEAMGDTELQVDVFGKPIQPDADDKKKKEEFPSSKHLSGNYYCYLRWMWVQFPWLGLQRTLDVGSILDIGGLSSVLAAVAAGHGKVKIRDGALSEDEANLLAAEGEPGNSAASKAKKNSLAVARSTRLWDVKKSDPSVPLFLPSSFRKNASVNATLLPQKVTDVMDLSLRQIRDDIANASAVRDRMPPKFRRSMDQEHAVMKEIPHAEHCTRSVKRGTLFPTLHAHIERKNKEAMNDDEKYSTALLAMRRGGPGLQLEKSLDDNLKELAEAEQMRAWNDRRGGALPIGSEKELEYEQEFERTVKLRAIANKMVTLRRQRSGIHEGLAKSVETREVQDEEIAAFMLSGEAAIEQLKEKLHSMTNALDEGKRLNNGYKLLIEMLQYNPPFNEKHVKQQQQQVELARQQLADLSALRHKMYTDAERDDKVKKKQIHTKVTYFREARANMRRKMDQKIAEHDSTMGRAGSSSRYGSADEVEGGDHHHGHHKHHHHHHHHPGGHALEEGSLAESDSSSKEMEEEARKKREEEMKYANETPKERMKRLRKERESKFVPVTEFKYDATALQSGVLKTLFKPHEEIVIEADRNAKKAQSKMMYDFAMEKTGSTSDEELVDRFMSSKKLTESLLAQQTIVDSRLAQLRITFDDLKSGGSGDKHDISEELPSEDEETHDARFYESQLFEREMHMASMQRQLENAVGKINEVRTGVTHLMNMLVVNNKMLHNLPKSRPPRVEGDESVAKGLSWCEERILAINETQMADSSKPKANQAGTEGKEKTLFTRQVELAEAIEGMVHASAGERPPIDLMSRLRESQEAKAPGGMSELLLNTGENVAKLNSPKSVLVNPRKNLDDLNDASVEELHRKRDAETEKFEIDQAESRKGMQAAGVHKFLSEALSTKESTELLRKTNLATGRVGRHAGLGYVLEAYTSSMKSSQASEI